MGFRLGRAQVAMEFVMLVMLAFMIMILFSIAAREQVLDIREEEEYVSLKDVAHTVQSEIITATNVEAGYRREFSIPESLEGIEYTIGISDSYLVLESRHHEYVLKVPPVQGNVIKGVNTIRNDGEVHLNE